MATHYLSPDEVIGMFWELVRSAEASPSLSRVEPATINDNGLASALGQPAQTWAGRELYPGLFLKAAVYARGVIQGHVFGNGNKRMGLAVAFSFLELNGYRVEISAESAVRLALDIANKMINLREMARVLRENSVLLEE